MRVFISWSGGTSRQVAGILRSRLAKALHPIDFWMSTEDMRAGAHWSTELVAALADSQVAILCLTRENLASPWILFEAGTVAHAVENRVIPYLFDLGPADLSGPLARFQAVRADSTGTAELFRAIYEASRGERLDPTSLQEIFEVWWPKLEMDLRSIQVEAPTTSPLRSEREVLEEILAIVRDQYRSSSGSFPKALDQPWQPVDFEGLSTEQLRSFFAEVLRPEAYQRAMKEYYGIFPWVPVKDVMERTEELARKQAYKLGIGSQWDTWYSAQGKVTNAADLGDS